MKPMTLEQIQTRLKQIQNNLYQGSYDDELEDLLKQLKQIKE